MFVMLVIVDCMVKACVYLCYQYITLLASVNSVNPHRLTLA